MEHERLVMLTDEDMAFLASRGARVTGARVMAVLAVAATLAAARFAQEGAAVERALKTAKTETAVAVKERDEALQKYESVKRMVAISVNAKQFTSPLHIKGDMLVSFAGEER